jgi:hypothetical protein
MEKQYESLKKIYESYETSENSEEIDKFKASFNQYQNVYNRLKDCSSYCVNGVYDQSTATCTCPNEKPFPFLHNDKMYCLTPDQMNTENIPNIPHTPDIQNKDKETSASPKDAPSFKVYGKYTKGDQSLFVMTQSNLFPQSTVLKEIYTSNLDNCLNECLQNKEATSFSYDKNKCSLYSNKNVNLTDFGRDGPFIVGTKNSPTF